ncbi:hypothetical protein O5559_29100, partial [Escherichia coli]|nr:hypothetical protein [Escherichia coli]
YHDPLTHEFIDRTQLIRSYTKPTLTRLIRPTYVSGL